MSANLFITAAFYVVNLMPRSFSYKLRLKSDSIRLLNVVVINAIIMQGAAAELFGGAKVGKGSMRLRSEQENANEGALDLPVTELDGTSEQGGVRGMVSATPRWKEETHCHRRQRGLPHRREHPPYERAHLRDERLAPCHLGQTQKPRHVRRDDDAPSQIRGGLGLPSYSQPSRLRMHLLRAAHWLYLCSGEARQDD